MDRQGTPRILTERGTTLFEMLAVLVPTMILAAGAIGFFSTQNRIQLQQDQAVSMEDNLRAAMTIVGDSVRTAGCAVPRDNLDLWINWTADFDQQPIAVTTAGAHGDRVSIAACSPQPVARLTAFAAAGATSIAVASDFAGFAVSDLFNTSDKSLLVLGEGQHAIVRSVNPPSLTIDTDPSTPGDQGLDRAFLAGTPITRVDVTTFEVDPSELPANLSIDRHRGERERVAEGIEHLRLITVEPGRRYRLSLRARQASFAGEGSLPTRTLVSDIRIRN